MNNAERLEKAKEFCAANLKQLCIELIALDDGGYIVEGQKLSQLITILHREFRGRPLAQALVYDAAMAFVVDAGRPGGADNA